MCSCEMSLTQTHFLEFNSCVAAAATVLWPREAFMASTSVCGGWWTRRSAGWNQWRSLMSSSKKKLGTRGMCLSHRLWVRGCIGPSHGKIKHLVLSFWLFVNLTANTCIFYLLNLIRFALRSPRDRPELLFDPHTGRVYLDTHDFNHEGEKTN